MTSCVLSQKHFTKCVFPGGTPTCPCPPRQQGTVQRRVCSRGRTRCPDCLDLLLGSSNSSLCFSTIGAGEDLGCSHDRSSIEGHVLVQRNEDQHLQPAARCGSDCCDLHPPPPTQQLDHLLSSDGGEGTAAHMSTSSTGTFSSPLVGGSRNRTSPPVRRRMTVLMEVCCVLMWVVVGACFRGRSQALTQGSSLGPIGVFK